MKNFTLFASVLSVIILAPIPLAHADEDTSANLPSGFVTTLAEAPGVILRVNIDQEGREDTGSAQLRVASYKVTNAAAVEQAFNSGIDTSSQPQVTSSGIAKDSSTFGFFPYTYYYGWQPAYYYYTYTPTYYYYGSYYTYGAPYYYYNNWGHNYRYYYYPIYYY